jgi:RND family efflux transporter MFP subunit
MSASRSPSAGFFASVFLIATFVAMGCGKTSADLPAGGPAAAAMPVQVRVAQAEKVPDVTEYLSMVKSRRSANINPQVEGYVTQIDVKSGDRVSAGTPLLEIDPLKQQATVGSLEAARAAQEANVHQAQVQLDRVRKLYEAGVTPKAELDNAESSYLAAAAQLKSLEEQVRQQQVELKYYQVRAPRDGVVGDIPVRVGDRVGVSTLLTTIDDISGLEAYIYVPADRAKDLRLGAPVHLLDDSGQRIAETRITFISPQVDTDTQTVLAKAAVDSAQGQIRVAQQVRAQVVWSTREATLIPILAVTRISGQFFAFVAVKESNGTVARQRLLRLGDIVGNDYVVLDGIKPGDHIILSGLQFLQDGAAVAEQIQPPAGAKAETGGKK